MDHIGIGFQGDEVRVQQDGPQQHGHLRVAAELFGRGVGQEDRQEVIGRVCDEVEEIVQISALVDPAEEGQHRQQSLDHTGTGDQRHQRGEHTGQRVQNDADPALLFLGRGGRLFDFLTAEVAQFHQFIVHGSHFVADDDLILAAFVHDTHHAGYGFDLGLVHAVH